MIQERAFGIVRLSTYCVGGSSSGREATRQLPRLS